MEMALLGERIPAAKALEWGLINRCTPDTELMDQARKLAVELAAGPKALGMIRNLMWRSLDAQWAEQLDAERQTGIKLTESYAMWPGSSVSGFYFAQPQSHYFGVGRIERDQAEDYARRKGWPLAESERWLAPILNYEPEAMAAAE